MDSERIGWVMEPEHEEMQTGADNYPNVEEVLAHAFSHEDYPEGPLERIEITFLASGEATWRVWAPRAEEPVGGYYNQAGGA